MKKIFLLSALALGAITLNAQLTYIGTIDGKYGQPTVVYNSDWHINGSPHLPAFQYYATIDTTSTTATIHINELATLSEVKKINVNRTIFSSSKGYKAHINVYAPYKNLWTTDDKIAFIVMESNEDNDNAYLINEDGKNLQSFDSPYLYFLRSNIGYLLFEGIDGGGRKVYQLPGNGEPTDLESPTAPLHTSNARKVVENGQMYIILDGVKYAVTGSTTM